MSEVEIEEYAMGLDDDEEDYDDDELSESSESGYTEVNSLDAAVVRIAHFATTHNIAGNPVLIRQKFFEETVRPLAQNKGIEFETLILASSQTDENYNKLLAALYPALAPHLSKVLDENNRQTLISVLAEALDSLDGHDEDEQIEVPSNSDTPESVEDTEDIDDFADEEDPEVIANTARVMRVYKDLFEVGFDLQSPFGVLTKEGSLRLQRQKTYRKTNQSFEKLYSLFNDITNGFLVQSGLGESVEARSIRNIDLRSGTTYYPEFQLGNLFGCLGGGRVDSWADLSRNIEPEIKRNIQANIEAGKDISQIVDALTTCMVISEFSASSALSLRVSIGNNLLDKVRFKAEYEKRKNTIFAGNGELFHIELTSNGVLEIILVFNKDAFNGKPLFAYEAIQKLQERGRKPSLKNMILGQDTSGRILTENLDTQQACIILIGAGQRSGKGVLTLNLLGTVLAEGNPLIYMDGKPDMAPVLWDLGKKYNVNPAAWDLFDAHGNTIGNGAPERMLLENPGIFGVLMYFKALQLMMVAASLQSKDVELLDGKRPFFIFDEAFAVQMTMASTWQKVLDIAKDKNADPDEKEWCTKVVRWAESLDADLPAIINSQLPKSGVSTVWLFQNMQPTAWNQYQVPGLGSSKLNIMKKPVESNLSMKFLGRGTSNSEYALGSPKVKENNLISTRVLSAGGRHFAKTGSQKVTDMESVQVFKPYLVLNESQNGTRSAEELKGNLTPDVLKVVAPDGELHPGAGFEGFAKMLGDDAIQNLSKGREYLEAVLSAIGVMQGYSTVDDYLYDTSLDSFKTLGELVSGMSDEASADSDDADLVYDATDMSETGDTQESSVPPIIPVPTPNPFSGENDSGLDDDGLDVQPLPDDSMPFPTDTEETMPDTDDGFYAQGSELEPPLSQTRSDRHNHDNGETYVPPSKQSGYADIYKEPMDMPFNPFGDSEAPMSAINAIKFTSNVLLKEIEKFAGGLSRIESVEVTTKGLVLNNIAFRPTFEQEVIDTMPFDIRRQVSEGNVTELFHFENLRKFPNLMTLRIDNSRLAEGRVRRELGLSPKKTWAVLFYRFKHLRELYIGGEMITDEQSAQDYDDRGRGGFTLTEKLRGALGVGRNAVSSSRMERVWDSKPVKVVGGAVGATAAVKVVSLAAMMFGPWGLLFGAFAGYGAYREVKKNRANR